jgi:hypothetical protein
MAKTEHVPILLPRASRNFPDVKTRNEMLFYNWTLKIIPFIWLSEQLDDYKNCNFWLFKK